MALSIVRAVIRWSEARVAVSKAASRMPGALGPREKMSVSATEWRERVERGRVMAPWREPEPGVSVEVGLLWWAEEGWGNAIKGKPRRMAMMPAALPMWEARWSNGREEMGRAVRER